MLTTKVNNATTEILVYIFIVVVLVLSALNIRNIMAPKKVLGIEVQVNTNQIFWEGFLSTNPNYIPGWLEVGRMDKVREIDPNWVMDKSE